MARRALPLLIVVVLATVSCGAHLERVDRPQAFPAGPASAGVGAVRGPCQMADGSACPPDGSAPTTEALTTTSTTTTTLPLGPTVRVVAAGDIACSPTDPAFNGGKGTGTACRMLATANVATSLHPQDVLELGDLQYDVPTLDMFQQSFALSWGRFDAIAHPALGNHEYEDPGAAGYFAYFGARAGPPGQGWYSYDEGSWHIVVLNANCDDIGGCGAGTPEGKWLSADLAANKQPCTLATWHQPRFSSGNEGDDSNGAWFWTALYKAGAELVLSGHHHQYERYMAMDADGEPDPVHGMTEIVAGTGGKSITGFNVIEPTSEVRLESFGVLALDLGPSSYSWQFVDDHGTVRDTGARSCHSKP